MPNQSVVVGGKTIPLVIAKSDCDITSRQPGGKYSVEPAEVAASLALPLFGTALEGYSNAEFITSDNFHAGTDYGWRAFDAYVPDARSFWYVESQPSTSYLTVECLRPRTLRSIRMFHDTPDALGLDYRPLGIEVQARNSTSESWITLRALTGVIWSNPSTNVYKTPSIAIANDQPYRYYRFRISKQAASSYALLSNLLLSSHASIDI